jgi:DNA-binding NarL/FixJ family response regulator
LASHPPYEPDSDRTRDRGHRAATRRQRDVLYLIVQGKTNKEIARSLGLGEGTVKIHVAALFGKLGVGSGKTPLLSQPPTLIKFAVRYIRSTSAIRPKADIRQRDWHVRLVPRRDVRPV